DGFEPTLGPLLEVGNVAAGAESAGTAGKDNTADRIVRLGLAQRPGHLRVHRLRQRVLLVWTVHPDDADAVLLRHHDLGGHRSSLRGEVSAPRRKYPESPRREPDYSWLCKAVAVRGGGIERAMPRGVIIDRRPAGDYVPPARMADRPAVMGGLCW